MQTKTDEQLIRQLLDESVALSLFDRVGTDAKGELLYSMNSNAEARTEALGKIIDSRQQQNE